MLALALVGCGASDPPPAAAPRPSAPAPSVVDSATVPSTSASSPSTTPPTVTAAKAVVTAGPPAFSAEIKVIDDALAPRLAKSWRAGCPVPLRDLRLVELTYWGFDDRAHRGELVIAARVADAVVWVFQQLYDNRFAIERMQLVDEYDADDDRSMVANNTSAFNCREVAGRPGVLSYHAFGTAIDINPLVNPWVRQPTVIPPEGAPYADRTQRHKGGIYPGDIVTRSFAAIGWGWGGDWPDSKDLQHFSESGR